MKLALGGLVVVLVQGACSAKQPRPPAPTTQRTAPAALAVSPEPAPPPSPPGPPPPPGPAIELPLAIDTLHRMPRDYVPDKGGFGADCYTALVERVEEVYRIGQYRDATVYGESDPVLLRTALTLDEIAACFDRKHRIPSKDPRIQTFVIRDSQSFAVAGDGWLIVGDPLTITNVLFTANKGSNPLGALLATPPTTPFWSAQAADFTSELLGVPSLGLVFEGDLFELGKVPVTARMWFADAATAKLARARLDHPPKAVAVSAFGPGVEETRAKLLATGTLSVEGASVVWRGTPPPDFDDELTLFRVLARPLGRPPAKVLPLGAACADPGDCAEPRSCYRVPGQARGYCTERCMFAESCKEAGMVCKRPTRMTRAFVDLDICMKRR